jgi:hypothetical protein
VTIHPRDGQDDYNMKQYKKKTETRRRTSAFFFQIRLKDDRFFSFFVFGGDSSTSSSAAIGTFCWLFFFFFVELIYSQPFCTLKIGRQKKVKRLKKHPTGIEKRRKYLRKPMLSEPIPIGLLSSAPRTRELSHRAIYTYKEKKKKGRSFLASPYSFWP